VAHEHAFVDELVEQRVGVPVVEPGEAGDGAPTEQHVAVAADAGLAPRGEPHERDEVCFRAPGGHVDHRQGRVERVGGQLITH
jgi:hypothetical protein